MNSHNQFTNPEFLDALRRLDIAERALRDARTQLEGLRGSMPSPAPAPVPPAPTRVAEPAVVPVTVPPVESASMPQQAPAPQSVKKPKDRESALIKAVAIIGGIITVLGVAFFVALAISSGLLGPVGRVVLVYLLAAALGAGAVKVHRSAPPAAVTALGVTSFYTTLATTVYASLAEDWWPIWFGAALMASLYVGYALGERRLGVGERCPNLHVWWAVGAVVIAVFYAFGSSQDLGGLVAFALPAVSVGLTAVFALPRRDTVRTIGALGALACLMQHNFWNSWLSFTRNEFLPEFTVVALLGILVLPALALYRPTGTSKQPGHWLAGIVVPFGMALVLLDSDNAWRPPSQSAGDYRMWQLWLLIVAFSAIVALAWSHKNNRYLFDAFLTALALLAAAAIDETIEWRPSLVLGGLLTAGFLAGLYFAMPRMGRMASAGWALAALMVLSRLVEGVISDPALLRGPAPAMSAALLGAVLLAAWFTRRHPAITGPMFGAAVVVFALFVSMLAVVGVVTYLGFVAFGNGGYLTAYYGAHAAVSIAWMVLGALILLRHRDLTALGVLLTGVAMVKLLFFDMAATDGLSRALAFLVCGVILLTIAVKRAQEKPESATATPEGRHQMRADMVESVKQNPADEAYKSEAEDWPSEKWD